MRGSSEVHSPPSGEPDREDLGALALPAARPRGTTVVTDSRTRPSRVTSSRMKPAASRSNSEPSIVAHHARVAQDARAAHQLVLGVGDFGPARPGSPGGRGRAPTRSPAAGYSANARSNASRIARYFLPLMSWLEIPICRANGIERADEGQRHPEPGLEVAQREDVVHQGEGAAVDPAGAQRMVGEDDRVPLALVAERARRANPRLRRRCAWGRGRSAPIRLHVVVQPPLACPAR